MTPKQVLQFAAAPRCPIRLPDRVALGDFGVIFDVPLFVSLHIERLDSCCKALRMLAESNLTMMVTIINLQQQQ